MLKQFIVGVGIGLGVAAGSIGAWTFQQRQAEMISRASDAVVSNAASETASEAIETVEAAEVTQDAPVSPSQPVPLSQAENDYLYDLAQALQPAETAKMDDAARLAIGRAIAGWAEAGAGYWDLRQKFDATYAATPFDRDIYLKYAVERFAPAHTAVLVEPQPEPIPLEQTSVQTRSVPTETEYIPIPSTEYIQAPVRIPGRPKSVPAPGKPPEDTAPGGSLLAPDPQPTITVPDPQPTVPAQQPTLPSPEPIPTPPNLPELPLTSQP